MSSIVHVLRVFLASPGDLEAERKITNQITDRCNVLLSEAIGWRVQLLGWEDTIPGAIRPQDRINIDVDRCDLFVGIMWKRWGQPPASGGGYSSGFEEEFSRARKRFEETGSPDLWMYFKEIPEEILADPGEQLSKVLDFRSTLEKEKKIFYKTFTNESQWSSVFEQNLYEFVIKLSKKSENEEIQKQESSGSQDLEKTSPTAVQVIAAPESGFSEQTVDVVRKLLDGISGDANLSDLSRVDRARLSLISAVMGDGKFGDIYLDVHVGNVLHTHRSDLRLGLKELSLLVRSALKHSKDENFPLWSWLYEADKNPLELLALYATIELPTEIRAAALNILTDCRGSLEISGFERINSIVDMFSTSTDVVIRQAAIRFLEKLGTTDDLQYLDAEIKRNDSSTINAAIKASVKIISRDSYQKAAEYILGLNENIPSTLSKEVFSNLSSLPVTTLEEGLRHRDGSVRAECLRLFRNQGGVSRELAEKLKADDSLEVRKEALLALIDLDRNFPDGEIRSTLWVSRKGGGLFGAFPGYPNRDEEKAANEVLSRWFSKADKHELLLASLWHKPNSTIAYEVLGKKYFKDIAKKVRNDVDDRFEKHFATSLSALKQDVDEDTFGKILKAKESTKDFVRQKFLRSAINVLNEKGDKKDLERIRKTLEADNFPATEKDPNFLMKHSDPSDLNLLVAISGRTAGLGLLSTAPAQEESIRAALALAKNNLSDLFKAEFSPNQKAEIVASMALAQFDRLERELVVTLLNDSNKAIRKNVAQKILRSKNKKEISEYLSDYLAQNTHYYNVVYWLDFGISASREIVNNVLKE